LAQPINNAQCAEWGSPESIEWFIADQAFSPFYDLAPPPPPLPSPVSTVDGDTHKKTENERQLADGRGGVGGDKSYNCEKALSSINPSILSGGYPYIGSMRNSIFSLIMSQGHAAELSKLDIPYFSINFEFFKPGFFGLLDQWQHRFYLIKKTDLEYLVLVYL
jgi:hypothetical protein